MFLPVQLTRQWTPLKTGYLRCATRFVLPLSAFPAQIGIQNRALAQVTLGSVIFEFAI